MLYVWFGTVTGKDEKSKYYVDSIDVMFDAFFEEKWTDNDWAKHIVEKIDKSKLISPKIVDSPWLGIIPITQISGGAKELIMMNNIQDVVYDGNNMGDNCFESLLELTKTKDIAIELYYSPQFNWVDGARVMSLRTGKMLNSRREWGLDYLSTDFTDKKRLEEIDWHINVNKNRLSFGEIDF